MSDSFKCKCIKCGKEQEYYNDTETQPGKVTPQAGMVKAHMDGWNYGRKAICWDCQQTTEYEENTVTVE